MSVFGLQLNIPFGARRKDFRSLFPEDLSGNPCGIGLDEPHSIAEHCGSHLRVLGFAHDLS
jgi:hypothetical protein